MASAESPSEASAEHTPEKISENILESASAAEAASAKSGIRIYSRKAKLIILRLFLRIGKNTVGLIDFLELLFCLFISDSEAPLFSPRTS